MRKFKLPVCLFLLVFPLFISAQEEEKKKNRKLSDYNIKASFALQLWASYTTGAQVFNEATQEYEAVDDRLNFQVRRTRFGIKGEPFKNVGFNLTGSLDFVGRDVLAGTEGGSNNGPSPAFRLWNAFLQWKIKSNSEHFNLIAGFFTPQIGRESTNSAVRTPSMEAAWSQNYLRRQLVGIGPGRSTGINLGGLFYKKERWVNWSYDLGVFNPAFTNNNGNSIGSKVAPLFTGRVSFYFGDPESEKYTIAHKVNYFGKRNGLTISLAGATQGATDLFESNRAAGFDFLYNKGRFNIDGDWTFMWREGAQNVAGNEELFTVSSGTGYIRTSYYFDLANGYIIEPAAALIFFEGALDRLEQEQASIVGAFAGTEQVYDLGFNFYFHPELKISIHYTFRNGSAGDSGPGSTFNNYFFQGGAGPILRGDWLGFGVVAIF